MIGMFIILFFSGLQVEGAPVKKDITGNTNGSMRFLAIADWGGWDEPPYTTPNQVDVAHQMAIVAERGNARFVLSIGDNIYMKGAHDVYDSRFKKTFERVYYQDSLQIPWYLIAGNHDHYGNVRAQIEYSTLSDRWNFRDFYYKITRPVPGGKSLDILLIDTIFLCGNTYGTANGLGLKGPKNPRRAREVWNWIEQNLKKSMADYVLVCGHYPVYSVGLNGPTDCLIERLEPLLYEYHVTAYLSGHDHNLQHIQTSRVGEQMNYFVIGSGGYTDKQMSHIDRVAIDNLKYFFAENGGFAVIDVSSTEMRMVFVDSRGTERYQYSMKPRKLK